MQNENIKRKANSIPADNFSGFEGSIFATSILVKVVQRTGIRLPFEFPFYGDVFDTKNNKVDEYIDKDAYTDESEKILEYVEENGTDLFEWIADTTENEADQLMEKSKQALDGLEHLSDEELLGAYSRFIDFYIHAYGIGAVTFLYEDILTDRLFDSLQSRLENPTAALGQLTTTDYTSFMVKSDELLADIHNAEESRQDELVNTFLNRYFYIQASYQDGPVLTKDVVLEMAQEVSADGSEIETPAGNEEVEFTPTQKEQAIADLFHHTEKIRDKRKQQNLIGSYTMFRFLDEVASRVSVDSETAKNIFWWELSDLLYEHIDENAISDRNQSSIVFTGNETGYYDYNVLQEREKDIDGQIEGTPAYSGTAKGEVCIVHGASDFSKFESDQILVTEMTRPDYAPIMNKAAAIVTDEGGITSHAAIVSREMETPCIIGTGNATAALSDGAHVVVDAEEGIVRKV